MAKIEITRTELVWPGKYNEDGTLKEVPRVSLPFQVIERVNESRATREAKKGQTLSLFDVYEGKEGDTFEEGWRNKLIWGDNLLVMGSLLDKFAGKIDLIYIDPPFATGADFSFTTEIGETGDELTKDASLLEEKAYRDTWGAGLSSYMEMITPRLVLMRDLLSDSGSIYVHGDWRISYCFGAVLRAIFGDDNFRNEIVWFYPNSGLKAKARKYHQVHDTLLHFSRTQTYTWNPQREPFEDGLPKNQPLRKFNSGTRKADVVRGPDGKILYKEVEDKLVNSVWRIPMLNIGNELLGYPTQKPEALLRRIVEASSNPGDLVADFFCGSGTTLAVAEKLGRRWIGCDLGRWGIHVTRKRLLGIENCKPFEVLNLGKYERQYWQGVTFGEAKDKPLAERALYEYLAFILKLYGAQPVAGLAYLHGKKGKAMVHIGAVDAPVTIAEIDAAVDECARLKQTELHVLGWEWEMGLYDLMVEAAKKKGVKLLLLQIPREVMEQQAAAKGDVRFFELAYLEAEIKQPKKLTAQVALKDFVIPNTELIPEEVRSKIKKWSDYIDYWAVDWDFQNDTFMQGWVAYRTRKERKLPLVSDPHTYEKAGKYRILIKVIDIFGNDTSQAFDVEVK
jgi:DNA modification methylase